MPGVNVRSDISLAVLILFIKKSSQSQKLYRWKLELPAHKMSQFLVPSAPTHFRPLLRVLVFLHNRSHFQLYSYPSGLKTGTT